MQVTRIYTGDDARSHFEELDIPLSAQAIGLRRTVSIYQWRDGEIKYVSVAPEK